MFTFEDGAGAIVDAAMGKYSDWFGVAFPLYEHLNITRSNGYDFSVKGAKRLSKLIDDCIAADKPVKKPVDYDERKY